MATAPQTDAPAPAAPRSERGFWYLTIFQFQNAFSDNVFKQFLILGLVATIWKTESDQSTWNGVVSGVFILPFFLFSTWSGFLADKYSKRTIALLTKVTEIVTLGATFYTLAHPNPHVSFFASLAILFLAGVQATVFSPSKYGIIPELVRPERLAWANGIIELTTFLAIIWGTSFATLLLHWYKPEEYHYVGLILVVLAVLGVLAGLGIDRTPAANPTRPLRLNFFPELLRYVHLLRADRRLGLTVLGLSYFWGLGIILLSHVNVWGMHSLGMLKENAGWLYVILSLGIGLGAVAAGYISRGKIELGLVPLGGIGLTLFAALMGFATPGLRVPMYLCLFMVGISAGVFSLPLNAVLQHHTRIEDRGGFLAANSFFNSLGMVLGTVFLVLFNAIFHPPANVLLFVVAAMTLLATIVLMRLLPDAALRLVAFFFTRIVYRIRATGTQHIPQEGPALLVANHVSFIDALLVMALTTRPVRFLVWEGLYQRPLLRWFLKATRCIPVGSGQRPRELLSSLRTASEALQNGELMCIFAEGQITRTGRLLPLRRGYEYILKQAPAPVVPIALEGVWGSIFSFEGGKFFWKRPRRLPYPVRAAVGEPLPPDTPPHALRRRLLELGADASIAGKADAVPLHVSFIRASRRNWKTFAALDVYTPAVSHGHLLIRSMILARRLREAWGEQEMVGALLPSSVGGAVANYAAALSGRTVVNLNYTTGQAVLDACARQCALRTTITARPFLEKVELTPPGEPIFIEDYRASRGKGEILAAWLLARFGTIGMIERWCGMVRRPTPDTLATIIFSSGSTGTPKGVMLTHHNIASNVESFRTGVLLWPHDRILGTLPFFHSFGYTVALWGSALITFGVVYHPNPLDVKTVGELVQKHGVSIIVTTPTFLGQYMRRLTPEQLGGINLMITGAERLADSLREAFRERFGIEPLQGYGTTECSPVVSVNIDDFRAPGFRQVGHKRGSIGHPLPGIAQQVRDAETGQPLPPGEPGLIWVKGPNIMQGYLGLPEKTAEVLHDGWYNTGDMGYVDEDGFTFITGRLSRFSKLGGEMVPHGAIEEKLRDLLELTEPLLVVTGVPDAAKGERLVVLHALPEEKLAGLQEKLAGAGLPNLWIPRRENYYKVEAIPMLGTGKLDLKAINDLARKLATGGEGAEGA